MSVRLLLVLVVVAACVLGACSDDGGGDGLARTADSGATPVMLIDLISFNGLGQVVYRWERDVPEETGEVVLRMDGRRRRWDWIYDDSAASAGDFTVRTGNVDTMRTFGCLWIAVPNDRSMVRTECGEGDGALPLTAAIGRALLPGHIEETLPVRTVVGRRTSCYAVDPLREICIDDDGVVLYLEADEGGTFEAVSYSEEFEPFDEPASLMRTSLTDEPQPAAAYDFPAEFELR